MTFVSTAFDGETLTGDLTIKDVTKPVTLDVEFNGVATDPWGNEKAAFEATAEHQPHRLGPHLERQPREGWRPGLREDQARPRRAARQAGLSPPLRPGPSPDPPPSTEAAVLPDTGQGGGLRRAGSRCGTGDGFTQGVDPA